MVVGFNRHVRCGICCWHSVRLWYWTKDMYTICGECMKIKYGIEWLECAHKSLNNVLWDHVKLISNEVTFISLHRQDLILNLQPQASKFSNPDGVRILRILLQRINVVLNRFYSSCFLNIQHVHAFHPIAINIIS